MVIRLPSKQPGRAVKGEGKSQVAFQVDLGRRRDRHQQPLDVLRGVMHLPLLAGLFMRQWGWLFPLPFRLPSSQGRAGWTGSSSRASGPRLLTSWSPEGGKGWTLSQPRTYSGSFQSEGSQLLSCPRLDCYLFDNTTAAQSSRKVNSKSGSSTQDGRSPHLRGLGPGPPPPREPSLDHHLA